MFKKLEKGEKKKEERKNKLIGKTHCLKKTVISKTSKPEFFNRNRINKKNFYLSMYFLLKIENLFSPPM